jgi:hypothetical protein
MSMEEPRPGQQPDKEQRSPEDGVYKAAAPRGNQTQTAREHRQIADAQDKAECDQAALRAGSHGDHQGEEGF